MELDVYVSYFNNNLDNILKQFNVSYAELAKYLGITRQSVHNWAKKKIKINRLIALGILYFFEKEKGIIIFVDKED